MGVVFRAEDTLLHRAVAFKVLTESVPGDQGLHRRWLREARAAAALNHPNICTIYEAGETGTTLVEVAEDMAKADIALLLPAEGAPYLAMELIEGPTLSTRIRQNGALPIEEVFDLAIQIAQGLAAAHQRGIVHRDLKPGNVMITFDARAKILDFGLARPLEGSPEGADRTAFLETVSHQLIRDGRVLGTLAYISPERALGKPGESQADVFSFGVMLYEMVSGVRPFQGETTTALLAKILEAEPIPPTRIRPDLSAGLARVIRRCLRKKPEDRYNDTRDLVAALREARDETAQVPARSGSVSPDDDDERTAWVPPPQPDFIRRVSGRSAVHWMHALRPRHWLATAAAAVAVAAAIFLAARFAAHPDAIPTARIQRIVYPGAVRSGAISADGNFVAFVRVATDQADAVVVQDLRNLVALEIYRGGQITDDVAFSPDGSEVAFSCYSRTKGDCRVLVVPFLGGPPVVVSSEAVSPICWSPDGKLLAGGIGNSSAIAIINRASGVADTVQSPHHHRWIEGLSWSPRGSLLLLKSRDSSGDSQVCVMTIDGAHEIPLPQIPRPDAVPQWSPSGEAIYANRSSSFFKLKVNPRTGEPSGTVIPMGNIVLSNRFCISGDGRKLVFCQNGDENALVRLDARTDTAGNTTFTGGWVPKQEYQLDARFSPAGDQLAAVHPVRSEGAWRLVVQVWDLDGGSERVIASDVGLSHPVWSPDGGRIAYLAARTSSVRVVTVDLKTGGSRVFENAHPGKIVEWANDDRLLYQRSDNRNYVLLDSRTGEERVLLRNEGMGVWQARPSPDGRWVAFARNVDQGSGMSVWIASLEDSSERPLYQGRAAPVGWSADGRQVYVARENPARAEQGGRLDEIVVCPLNGDPPTLLCAIPGGSAWSTVDVTRDGRHVVYTRLALAGDLFMIENFDPEVR